MIYTHEKLEQLRHRWTTAKGKKLIKIIRESRCYLSPVLFRERVKNFGCINDDEVIDSVDLRGAPLAGFDFRVPIPEEDSSYSEEIAILSSIHFEGASLKYCNFQDGKMHDCYFEHADLFHAEFKNATLSDCNFHQATCNGINVRGTKLVNCNFSDASIKDITFDSTIVDQKTGFGKKLKSEQEGHYRFASIEYKQIKEMFKNSSLHGLADEYHFREMVAKRKIRSVKHPLRFLGYVFGDLLCKYGTSFIRVLLWSFLLILFTALLHTQHGSLMYHNTPVEANFFDSLYFSIVTFTTLGYGDYHATGIMRYLAAAEAFLGTALMALFTVIVARNVIRD
jgi:hypothetical protein